MSHSVFRDFDAEQELEGNKKIASTEQNLIVFINKDGDVQVDPQALQDLIVTSNDRNATVSVIRLNSPTPSMQSNKSSDNDQDDDDDDSMSENSSKSIENSEDDDDDGDEHERKKKLNKKKNKVPSISLTLESFYNPEQAIQFAEEIMNVAGITNPKQLKIDYDHIRYVIENDHCYTPLTYNDYIEATSSKKSSRKADTKTSSTTNHSSNASSTMKKLSNSLIGNKSQTGKSTEKDIGSGSRINNQNESVDTSGDRSSEAEEAESEADLSDFSESESDNDRDSDLDFSVNDLHSRRTVKKRRKRKAKKMAEKMKKRREKELNDTGASDGDAITGTRRRSYASKKDLSVDNSSAAETSTSAKTPRRTNAKNSREQSTDDSIVSPATSKTKTPKQIKYAAQKPQEKKSSDSLVGDTSSLFSSPDIIKKVNSGPGAVNLPVTLMQVSTPSPVVVVPKLLNGNQLLTRKKVNSVQVKLATEQDKQLDLIDSLVQEELKKDTVSIPASTSTNSNFSSDNTSIPSIMKMLETSTTDSLTNVSSKADSFPDDHFLPDELLEGLTNSDDCLTEIVAKLAEDKNLQEVIDKQVLAITNPSIVVVQQPHSSQQQQMLAKRVQKVVSTTTSAGNDQVVILNTSKQNSSVITATVATAANRQEPIKIVRSDGRIITLPPIEAPTTRGAKRRAEHPATPESSQSNKKPIILNSLIDLNATATSKGLTFLGDLNKTETRERRASIQSTKRNSTETTPKRTMSLENAMIAFDDDDDYDDRSDGSYNSEDDPLRLWCICRRPHNNRFMICCDKCEDWFHGKCVGVTKQMGVEMEQCGIEWVCPNCLKKQQPLIKDIFPRKEQVNASAESELNESGDKISNAKQSKCLLCDKSTRLNSIYCSDECIRKHANAAKTNSSEVTVSEKSATISIDMSTAKNSPAEKQTTPAQKVVLSPSQPPPKILNSSLPLQKADQPQTLVRDKQGSKYIRINLSADDERFARWMSKHPTYEIVSPKTAHNVAFKAKQTQLKGIAKSLEVEREYTTTPRAPTKLQTTLSFDTEKKIVFVNSQGKIAAAAGKKLSDTNQMAPKSQHLTSISKHPKLSSSPQQQKSTSQQKKTNEHSSSSSKFSLSGNPIRNSVQKTLIEQLILRTKEVTDDKAAKLTEDEIKEFVKSTEDELYKMFGDTNNKYKAKYRSLVFNIKDRKNKTLFDKISSKSIQPKQLVKMSPDDLASQELAKWRENENKHQIEMITKTELDNLSQVKNYLVKTHKGEEEIEAPVIDVQDVLSGLKSPDTESETAKAPSVISSTSKSSHSDRRSESDRKTSSSSSKKRKERSRSRERHHSSSSKHKRHRSRERHKSHDHDRRDKDDKEHSRHRSRSRKSHSSSDAKKDKHDREHKSSDHSKTHSAEKETDKNESASASTIRKDENHSLADKIREAETTINRILHPEEFKEDNNQSTASVNEQMDLTESSPPIPEPTTTIPTKETIWHGTISMVDIQTFHTNLKVLDGDATEFVFPNDLYVVGRIEPDAVWSYLMKIKITKELIFLKFDPDSDEDISPYKAFSKNLINRHRFGVFDPKCEYIKDFYILPYNTKLPSFIMPTSGLDLPGGFDGSLIGIIVKTRPTVSRHPLPTVPKHNRNVPPLLSVSTTFPKPLHMKPTRKEDSPPTSPNVSLPKPIPMEIDDGDEPYSPEDSDEDSTFTPGPANVPPSTSIDSEQDKIQREMEELNRQIEAEKMEIALLNTGGDLEPYSPSSSVASPVDTNNAAIPTLANISIPANIVDILKSIKESSGSNDPSIATTSAGYVPTATMYGANIINSNEYVPITTTVTDTTLSEPSRLAQLTDEELLRLVPDDSF